MCFAVPFLVSSAWQVLNYFAGDATFGTINHDSAVQRSVQHFTANHDWCYFTSLGKRHKPRLYGCMSDRKMSTMARILIVQRMTQYIRNSSPAHNHTEVNQIYCRFMLCSDGGWFLPNIGISFSPVSPTKAIVKTCRADWRRYRKDVSNDWFVWLCTKRMCQMTDLYDLCTYRESRWMNRLKCLKVIHGIAFLKLLVLRKEWTRFKGAWVQQPVGYLLYWSRFLHIFSILFVCGYTRTIRRKWSRKKKVSAVLFSEGTLHRRISTRSKTTLSNFLVYSYIELKR